MAKENFPTCLAYVLESEGGFVDDPRDPGGATNKGVTQAVYDDYRKLIAKPKQSVRFITNAEVGEIYKHQYWDAVKGDLLPKGLDYVVFDYAVNSGVVRAIKNLQGVLGVVQDGMIGVRTIAAIPKPCSTVIAKLCETRLGFLHGLRTWIYYGRGWSARVATVKARALKMV